MKDIKIEYHISFKGPDAVCLCEKRLIDNHVNLIRTFKDIKSTFICIDRLNALRRQYGMSEANVIQHF